MSIEQGPSAPEVASAEYTPPIQGDISMLLDLAKLNARGEPHTFGATPLDKLSTMAQEEELFIDLKRHTYNIPAGVPLEIADYVHETFRDRFYSRITANDDNYSTSLLRKNYYQDQPSVVEVISRAEEGHASPAELLLVRQLLGIGSVELACLTHPYGGERMKDELGGMRGAVRQAVLILGGEYIEEPKSDYRIKEVILRSVPHDKFAYIYSLSSRQKLAIAQEYGGVAGLLMTRKRALGTMPDGTVVRERSSLVLREDKELGLLSDEAIAAMASVVVDDESKWGDAAVKAAGLNVTVGALMKEDEHTLAIPLSSTIYAHNEATSAQVEARQLLVGNTMARDYLSPSYLEDVAERSYSGKIITNFGGMFYTGPEPEESYDNE